MIKLTFDLKASYLERIKRMSVEQRGSLCHAVAEAVIDDFQGLGKGYRVQEQGYCQRITITVQGLCFNGTASPDISYVAQQAANALNKYGLDNFFFLTSVGSESQALDIIFMPSLQKPKEVSASMLKAFGVNDDPLSDYTCPITGVVIEHPAFLETNPKVLYERKALMKWVSEHGTDPTTRARVEVPTITDAPRKQMLIRAKIIELVLGEASVGAGLQPVSISASTLRMLKLVKKESDAAAAEVANTIDNGARAGAGVGVGAGSGSSASAESSRSRHTNSTSNEVQITRIFATCKMQSEINAIYAKALRRLSFSNRILDLRAMLNMPNCSEFINIQDRNSSKLKTALHIAVEKGYGSIVKALLNAGAKADIPDANGKTAQQLIDTSNKDSLQEFKTIAVTTVTDHRA